MFFFTVATQVLSRVLSKMCVLHWCYWCIFNRQLQRYYRITGSDNALYVVIFVEVNVMTSIDHIKPPLIVLLVERRLKTNTINSNFSFQWQRSWRSRL